ncbi:hypothetical protein [Mycobacterium sp. 1423905.2]|uniref:DUF7159 family protein n=1 Tax=Mycobacterium sp. 1423905.2 TaxID=1856859 RepID=UPI000802349E|nr:hypothetical protein [Mycobacterium sp. 1423905.2]OBJ53386.1 hypothetical protein A9W95_18140 [Mycobacterium sp. 1423905.2]
MDIVLGVSMEATAVRLVLIEGQNADGVTVEEENFEVARDAGASGAAGAVLAAIVGTREGASEGGYQLTSVGVTWTRPDQLAPLREQLAQQEVGNVMLVSPLLAAAALAQTVGAALAYDHIALVLVESGGATLAVVDTADGSIVDLHRRSVGAAPSALAAELATMVAGLDAPGSRAKGVLLVGCGVDIMGVKPALEAATSLVVSVPEEPHLALARGAALASANAPLFAASTAALAYALDPGTGEVSTRGLSTYLDVCATAQPGALAYSAVDDDTDLYQPEPARRRPLALAAGAMGGIAAVVAGALVVSLASDVRPAATHPSQHESVQLPPASPSPAAPSPVAPPVAPPVAEAAAPPAPPPIQPPPPQTVTQPAPQTVVNMAPPAPQPRRAPTRQAPAPAPVQQAPPAATAPPAAPPAPPPPTVAPPPSPVMTMYLHLPFVSVPIPINPPPPPAPPEP